MGKVRRTLSILLAVAMVVTCVPQAGLTASAAELDAAGAVESTAVETTSLTNEDSNVIDEDIAIDEGEKDKEEEAVSDEETVGAPADDEKAADSGEDGIAMSPMETGEKHTVTAAATTNCTITLPSTEANNATEGTDFSFTVKPTDDFKITEVSYTVGSGQKQTLTVSAADAVKESTYTIPGAEITADVVVSATAEAVTPDEPDEPTPAETVDLTIDNYLAVKKQVTIWVKVGTGDATLVTGATTAVEKGKSVTLELTPKAGYKIKSVMDGDKAVAATAGTDLYVIGAVSEAKTIKITTAPAYDFIFTRGTTGVKITLDVSLEGVASALTLGNTTDEERVVVEKAANQAVTFTVTGAPTDADKKLHLYYVVDGSEDDREELKATDGKYTIPAKEISLVEESVEIIPEVETKSAVNFVTGDKVDVKVQGPKGTDGKDTWVATTANGAIKSAFIGDEFKFKAEGTGIYAVSKVTVDDEEIKPDAEGVYTIILEGPTTVDFETEISSTKSVPLTFTITGAEKSATAEITSVTLDGDTPEEITDDAERIAEALGITLPEYATKVELEAGKAVRVPNTVTALTVKVAPANGYALSKAANETVAKDTYKFAAKNPAADETAMGEAMNVSVTTEIVKLGKSVYFKPKANANDKGLVAGSLTVKPSEYVAQAKDDQGEVVEGVYEVKKDATTVELTVKVKEGYTLNKESSLIQSVKAAEEKEEDGSTEYTIALFAAEIVATDPSSAVEVNVASAARTFTAKVEPADKVDDEFEVSDFKYTAKDEDGVDNIEYVDEETEIPYGASLSATIYPVDGYSLTSVTYTMGGDPVPVTVLRHIDYGYEYAEVSIDKVTADVTIKVECSEVYYLPELIDEDYGYPEYDEWDGVYSVRYDKAYLVGVMQGDNFVPAKDIKAVVKDAQGNEVPMSTPSVALNYRKINLANKPELRGQDITVEMYVAGVEEKVGTYVLSVNKATTKIEIQDADGNKIDKINLTVGSRAEYKIDTDGTLICRKADDAELIKKVDIEDGKLVIEMAAKDSAAIKDKTATITVAAEDDEDLKATVSVTAKALFDETGKPTVTKTANGAADTEFNVDVAMDLGADFKEPVIGSVWYEVTATAKTGTDFPTDKLDSSVTKTVRRTGDSTRVKLQVGKSDLLGNGAAWDYEVTAKLVYKNTKYESGTNVAWSADSAKADCSTIEPLYTTALKLKKGSDKVALYTGRDKESESVIATIQWDTKKDNDEKFYKVANENIQDDKSGLTFEVRGDQIVVTDIDVNADLGKHTITVLATSDQTPGHEMYASRATIAVTVVKGINNIIVTTPSTSIYKPEGTSKAATLKLGVDYNHRWLGEPDDWYAWKEGYASWDGKKYVTAPKSKKVTWEIVGADSYGDEVKAPENIANYVKVKNGTVTVDKRFQVDQNRASNNRFMVKVTAADYAGNETTSLSDPIEISNNAVDISKLIIVNWDDDGTAYEVKAVHGIKDKGAVSISASDADEGCVYALPESAAVKVGDKFADLDDLYNKLPVVDTYKITFASGNKKVLEVDERGWLTVNAAGKKAAVKVSTADGSNNKKTHTMNLTLDYKETAGSDLALGIRVRTADNYYSGSSSVVFDPNATGNAAKASKANETPVTAEFTTTGAARLYVELYVGNKADATSTSYSDDDVWSTNYKLAVKGGKFVTNANGTATIITTAKETTLTLTDQSPEAKKAKKAAYVYKLTNTAYDTAKMAKAPKVTVKNTLREFAWPKQQKVEMSVLDATKAAYAAGKSVKVEMDWSARNEKNKNSLDWFAYSIKSNVVALNADGSMNLEFILQNCTNKEPGHDHDYDYVNLPVGSYKLKVTVGTVTDGVFKAETLPTNVTVKVVKNKVATYKLNATYTIGELDGAVTLTGKSNLNAKAGEKMATTFYGLKNANVNGKVNDFTKYFKIDKDATTGTSRLVMTDALKAELAAGKDMTTVLGSKGLTGYISYWAWPDDVSYYDQSKLNATDVKITVKPAKPGKTGSAYKSSSAEVGTTDKGNKTRIDIVVNGEKVNVKYAAIDAAKTSNEFEIDGATGAKNGQVALKVKAGAEIKAGKSYTANLKVVPADSFYASKIDDAVAAAAQTPSTQDGETTPETPASASVDDLIQQYGIAVKVSVKASESYVNPAEGTEEPNPNPNPDPTPDPGPSVEITLDKVEEAIGEVAAGDWKKNGAAIVVTYETENGTSTIKDGDTVLPVLIEVVNTWIKTKGEGYTDFSVAKIDTEVFKLADGNASASVKVTLKKGDGTAQGSTKVITITIGTKDGTTVVTPPAGGEEGGEES